MTTQDEKDAQDEKLYQDLTCHFGDFADRDDIKAYRLAVEKAERERVLAEVMSGQHQSPMLDTITEDRDAWRTACLTARAEERARVLDALAAEAQQHPGYHAWLDSFIRSQRG